jgi:hypothetical protein
LLAASASRIAKGEIKQRTLLSSWNAVIDYCRTSMAIVDIAGSPLGISVHAILSWARMGTPA